MPGEGGVMDPMDFTMDEGQQIQHSNPSRCHYPQSQPHQASSSNNFLPSQSHNAHHYDPVHNTDWYSQTARPQYTAPQNISQYGPGQHLPITNWQGFAGEGHIGMLGDNSYRQQQPGYMSSQWNSELRGFPEASPFGYSPYMLSSGNMPGSTNSGAARNAMAPAPSATAPPPAQTTQPLHTRRYFDGTAERHRHAVAVSAAPPTIGSSESSRNYDLSSRNAAENRRQALHAQISSVSRSQELAHSYAQDLANHRRRVAQTSESDDDEDLAPDMDRVLNRAGRMYAPERAEREEILIAAAMRGQLATGKKVPSKEAIASLEKLVIKDMNESDKSCIICYNDFGVPNPEGLIEHPLRLPKCKHIFGDNCIKKWFEDSDTCPYCRDKLPSERVPPKSFSSREAYHRYRERAAGLIASQAAFQQSRRSATGGGNYPTRFPSSEELAAAARYNRYSGTQDQENYQYPMRPDSELWTFSTTSSRAAQRESPERRRQQTRGRTSFGRPTSVGSSRFNNASSSFQSAFQRGIFQGVNANTNGTGSMARRPTSPGFTRQNSDRTNDSTTNHHSLTHNRLSAGRLGSSSPEASPPVAVGSGVASVDRSTAAPQVRFNAFPDHLWLDHDQHGGSLGQSDASTFFPPGRANDFARAISFGARAGISQNNENTQAPSSFANLGPMPPGLGGPLPNQPNLNRR